MVYSTYAYRTFGVVPGRSLLSGRLRNWQESMNTKGQHVSAPLPLTPIISIPAAAVVEATGRAYGTGIPPVEEEVRSRLEWAWGLKRGTLDEHLGRFVDTQFVEILMNDNFIVIAHSDAIMKIFLATSNAPFGFVKSRTVMHDLYLGSESFEYLVVTVDPSAGISPYATAGATFQPNAHTFTLLRYVHEGWATCYVPPRFLGVEEGSNEDEESDEESSTMEWEVGTVASEDDEPQRRLLPHEFETDPVPKFQPVSGAIEDDAISVDSYITGVEDPEEFYKTSLARGIYETDPSWSKGIRSWAQSASGIDDEKVLLNDGQIETDPREKPRVATSLNLDKPDWQITAARTR
ncbi:hypothetical protein MVEN_01067000 [Mycena venus]|uniref:Uncharacterized protein n=1 Tax=Mycena venus TaxID=2733690 RepID=A0A8H7CX57_9AGAR|nr:hypothetical protein MVEN_01067000 [Mycena venus]